MPESFRSTLGEGFDRTSPCDLCSAQRVERIARCDRRGKQLDTVVCTHCGLVSHEHVPSDDELAAYYAEDYRADYHGEITPRPHRVVRAWQVGQRLVSRLEGMLRRGDRVFEVGAGIGCTVKNFELAGFDATGVEPNRGFQTYGRNRLAAQVENFALEDVTATPQYDAVLLVHVIEHFNAPRRALEHIRSILNPGGLLYVECPNLAAPHAAPGRQFHYAHVFNFTPDTLAMMAAAAGFRVKARLSGRDDRNLMFVLTPDASARLQVDPAAYGNTIESLYRYNTLTYHLRFEYVRHRLGTMAWHGSHHVAARRRVDGIARQCAIDSGIESAASRNRAA